ncbi:MAG: hypothetical protein NTZ33_15185 [Bacteroidetes bacterium]|nr:hypothetical protein [Bacteroidota bacterium]
MKTILVISMLMCISIVSFAQSKIHTELKSQAIEVINSGTENKLPNLNNTENNPTPKNLSIIDAGVIMILSPYVNIATGDIITVTVRIKNFGADTLINIPVNYQLGNGVIASTAFTGNLKPDSSAYISFPQTFMVGTQNFTIRAFTSLAGDTNMLNDTIVKLVTVGPAQKDVGVSKIILPGYSTSVNAQVTVKVMIKNYGLLTQTVIPVSYQRGLMPPNDEIWTGMLAPGDTVIYTFTNLMNVPVGDHFTMCSYTRLANDAYIYNDSICKSVVICNVNAAGNINGPAYPPCGYTSQYSVPAITNAISYNWVINPAAAGTISGTGTTVTITFSSNPGIAYVSQPNNRANKY